jgi:hypothetical protein
MQAAEATPTPPRPEGCLGCSRLENPACNTVVLLSGETVCTWCEAWRLECYAREVEARAILAMSDREVRRAHLSRLEARHGAEYRARLEATVLGLWERRRAAQAARSGASDA